ncbi:MAG: N-acetyltransferase family protein [Bifidobacterium adolescentis]
MADYSFRIATQDDIQAITDIYNAAVIRGGSSADTTPRTYAQRKAWVESHHDPYAVFVTTVPATDAATEGGERIIGFSALSVFYDRAGYDGVTDLAYYIAPEWQGRGAGTFTLAKLLDECRNRHMRKACGIIFADNRGSIALMKHFGFTHPTQRPAATDSTGTARDSYQHLDL